jgi:hypothetical protein
MLTKQMSTTKIHKILSYKEHGYRTIILGLEFSDLALLKPNPVAKKLTTKCFKNFFASATFLKNAYVPVPF